MLTAITAAGGGRRERDETEGVRVETGTDSGQKRAQRQGEQHHGGTRGARKVA